MRNNRGAAWISLDGANRIKLEDGESIEIAGSLTSLKMVTLTSDNLTDLWAQRLVKHFGWNVRENQKVLQKQQKLPSSQDITNEEEKKE